MIAPRTELVQDAHNQNKPVAITALPVYVISLVRAQERRAWTASQLNAQGIDFGFFEATDYRDMDSADLDAIDSKLYLLRTGRLPAPGEIACFVSHRRAWTRCVEEDRPCVILEDDFSLSNEFLATVSVAARYIDALGFIRLQTERRGMKHKLLDDAGHTLWRYTKVPHSTGGYVISPAAATVLLQSSLPLAAPVDVYLKMFWLHRQLIFGLTPYTIADSTHSGETCITGRVKPQKSLAVRLHRISYRTFHWLRRHYTNLIISDRLLMKRLRRDQAR